MPLWKQLTISIALIFVSLCAWVYFSPGAGQTLVSMGVPQSVVSLVSRPPRPKGRHAVDRGKADSRPNLPGRARARDKDVDRAMVVAAARRS